MDGLTHRTMILIAGFAQGGPTQVALSTGLTVKMAVALRTKDLG